jgi:hypothetical protein
MQHRLAVVLAAILLAACSSAVTPAPSGPSPTSAVLQATDAPTPVAPESVAPTMDPGPYAADLDGVLTTADLAHRLPLFVAIDDNKIARPQSGFNAASVIWQAPADGYETRYLLGFQELDAPTIGPVRSGRLYLAQWAAEWRGALAHYGGDRLTRAWMTANAGSLFTDIDGLGTGNGAFHRISTRVAPHNAYTSTADLRETALRLGGPTVLDSAVHLRPFRDDSPSSTWAASQSITVPYNTGKVGYRYDAKANLYLRSISGKAHIDPADGAQVTARTVVVLYMTFRTDSTIEPGHNRPVLGFVGSGKAQYFMEGHVVDGTWSKAGEGDPTLFLGPDGTELPLLRGRLIIQVVPIGTKVTVAA